MSSSLMVLVMMVDFSLGALSLVLLGVVTSAYILCFCWWRDSRFAFNVLGVSHMEGQVLDNGALSRFIVSHRWSKRIWL